MCDLDEEKQYEANKSLINILFCHFQHSLLDNVAPLVLPVTVTLSIQGGVIVASFTKRNDLWLFKYTNTSRARL